MKTYVSTIVLYNQGNEKSIGAFHNFVEQLQTLIEHTAYTATVVHDSRTRGPLIVRKHTTDEQYAYIQRVIEERLTEWLEAPDPDESDGLYQAALFNFLCDMGVEGYESPDEQNVPLNEDGDLASTDTKCAQHGRYNCGTCC